MATSSPGKNSSTVKNFEDCFNRNSKALQLLKLSSEDNEKAAEECQRRLRKEVKDIRQALRCIGIVTSSLEEDHRDNKLTNSKLTYPNKCIQSQANPCNQGLNKDRSKEWTTPKKGFIPTLDIVSSLCDEFSRGGNAQLPSIHYQEQRPNRLCKYDIEVRECKLPPCVLPETYNSLGYNDQLKANSPSIPSSVSEETRNDKINRLSGLKYRKSSIRRPILCKSDERMILQEAAVKNIFQNSKMRHRSLKPLDWPIMYGNIQAPKKATKLITRTRKRK